LKALKWRGRHEEVGEIRPHSRLIGRRLILRRVKELARQIEQDYQGKHPLLLGALKGSFVFLADLVRQLRMPVEVDFIGAASYGHRTASSGEVNIYHEPRLPIGGRHVILVEDIVDTGATLAQVVRYLQGKKPASLRICALLRKMKPGQHEVEVHYLGFQVPDQFLVGYGLDCQEQFRHLPDIWTVKGVEP
jgi:hypoxanthine phosphoribosyltransferase